MTGLVVRGRAVDGRGDGRRRRRRRAASSTPARWSTPARIRISAAAAVALACCLAAVIAAALVGLGGQFRSIGDRDAPAVNSTTGLYFSLNDMDAQVANVLLVGGDASLAADRAHDLAIYGSDRATADADLTQALATEAGNAAAQRELRSVLDGVGQYEALAADALLTDQQAAQLGPGPRRRTRLLPAGDRPDADQHPALGLLAHQRQRVHAQRQLRRRHLDRADRNVVVIVAGGLLLAVPGGAPALPVRTLPAAGQPRARRRDAGRGRPRDHVAATRLSAEAGHLRVAKQDALTPSSRSPRRAR